MENKPSQIPDFNEFVSKYSHYLSEIRKKLFLTFFVYVAGAAVGFLFYENIIRFVLDLFNLKGVNIVFTSPFQFMNLAISCGITTGLVLVIPLIIYQILSFLRPALKREEFKMIVGFMPLSVFLFICGFAFGFLIMRWQVEIFSAKSVSLGIGNVLDISSLISTVLITAIFMGIGFQFPVVLMILMRIGIIKGHHLARQRLWVYLGSFIFAVLLPPDSVLADILLALPFIILFEIVLISNRISQRKIKKQLKKLEKEIVSSI